MFVSTNTSMGKSHTGIHWFSQNQSVPVCFLPSVYNQETYRSSLIFKMVEKLKNSEFLYVSANSKILQKYTGIDLVSNWPSCRVTRLYVNSCMFLTQTLRVRNIQEFTDFQKITLFLGKNLVRNIQELTYIHTENKSVPVFFFKTICWHEMYRNWLILRKSMQRMLKMAYWK